MAVILKRHASDGRDDSFFIKNRAGGISPPGRCPKDRGASSLLGKPFLRKVSPDKSMDIRTDTAQTERIFVSF